MDVFRELPAVSQVASRFTRAWFKTPAIRVRVLALSTGWGPAAGFASREAADWRPIRGWIKPLSERAMEADSMQERLLPGPGSPPSPDPVHPELSPPPQPCQPTSPPRSCRNSISDNAFAPFCSSSSCSPRAAHTCYALLHFGYVSSYVSATSRLRVRLRTSYVSAKRRLGKPPSGTREFGWPTVALLKTV